MEQTVCHSKEEGRKEREKKKKKKADGAVVEEGEREKVLSSKDLQFFNCRLLLTAI